MNWYYAKDGQQTGPVAFAEIERLHAAGELGDDSLVWQQGTANWIKLSAVVPAAPPPLTAETAQPIPGPAPASAPLPVAQSIKTNALAITSFVLGVLGLFCCTTCLLNLAAIICGHVALSQISKNPPQGGRGLAIAGLVLGYLALFLGLGLDLAYAFGYLPNLHDMIEQQRHLSP